MRFPQILPLLHRLRLSALLLCGLAPVSGFAAAFSFQVFSAPGYTQSVAYGIDNSGNVLVGAGSQQISFLRDPSANFIAVLDQGGNPFKGLGMNNVGDFVSGNGFIKHGDGTYTEFHYPGTPGPGTGMQANDINDFGYVVGSYTLSPTDKGSFIRAPDGQYQTFSSLTGPKMDAHGINNAGDISGVSGTGGFIRYADGTFVTIAAPGATETQVFGLNNFGQVVGYYVGSGVHGFRRDPNGTLTPVEVPEAQQTIPMSVNDAGQVVGVTYINNHAFAFIATPAVPEPSAYLGFASVGLLAFIALRNWRR